MKYPFAKPGNLPSLICAIAAGCGALCLLASFCLAWFPLPSAAGLKSIDAPCSLLWKLVLAVALGVTISLARRRPAQRRIIACVSLAVILAALLGFPCSLLYLAPEHAARANWIQIQHRNLTSPGGDISASADVQNRDWDIHFNVTDLPRQIGAVQIPKSVPYVLDLGRLTEMSEWLGYSEAFCSFAGVGWMLAVGGSLLLLAAAVRGTGTSNDGRVRLAVITFGSAASAFLAIAIMLVLATGFAVGRAHAASQAGDYAAARRWLDRAGAVMPVIRENSFYIIQQGIIDGRLGRDSIEARHYQAMCLENGQFYSQADAAYQALLGRAPANSPIQREIVRDVLRMAMRNMKSDELQRSIPLFEEVLHYDAANIKANHCLQIAYMRLERYTELQGLIVSMRQVYTYMGNVSKLPALGACLDTEAALRFHKGDLEGALADRRTSP